MTASIRNVGAASTPGIASPHSVPTPTIVAGDVLVAVLEYGTGATSNHATAAGWTELAWHSTVAVTGRTDLAVMGRIADGTEGASVDFAITGTVNHASGRMVSIRDHGCSVIGDVAVGDIAFGAAGGADPQTNTLPGVTVIADSLILMVAGSARDVVSTTEFSNWTNANLTSITERMDNMTTTGNGGGYGMATGICAGTTTGDSTYEQAIREAWNGVHLGIPSSSTSALAEVDSDLPAFLSASTVEVLIEAVLDSDLPAFVSAAAAEVLLELSITSDLPAFVSAATASRGGVAEAAIASQLPAFLSEATAEVSIVEFEAVVASVLPAFTSSVRVVFGGGGREGYVVWRYTRNPDKTKRRLPWVGGRYR